MKTTCETIELLLTEFASGELAAADRDRVERHLEGCAACRDELAREERLRVHLGALPAATCPPDVTAAIKAATRAAAAPRITGRHRLDARWTRAAAGLGLAAAVVLIGLILRPPTPPTPATLDVAVIDSTIAADSDLERARRDVEWALSYTAAIVDRAEKESIAGVLKHLAPASTSGS